MARIGTGLLVVALALPSGLVACTRQQPTTLRIEVAGLAAGLAARVTVGRHRPGRGEGGRQGHRHGRLPCRRA